MKYSQLDESHIYAVKRAIDEITKIDFEDKSISFDSSEIPDRSEMPDAIQLEEQIRENLQKCSSKIKYVNKLIGLFPYLDELIDFLTEETVQMFKQFIVKDFKFCQKGSNLFYYN